ncbi:peptidoglycan-associated lipoprotein Pal [Acanthopleuribacter pedis]|uniref:peptidoglycan-associated lipoprotein Pal n=1 Tax=Acanthopleuribacter pedis TaxID=442870 RepID=UPI00311C9C80
MSQPVNHDFEWNRTLFSFLCRTPVGVCLLLLVLLSACGGPKPPVRGPNLNSDGDTVYDNNRGGGNDDATRISEDEVGYPTSPYDEESIDSQKLNVIDTYNSNLPGNLDWDPVFFNFDQSALTESARDKLSRYAQALKANPDMPILLEGHADTRGTDDYNLALGERRAQAVKRYLLQLGVPANQMRTISYGELKPLDPSKGETAWAKNRRVSFTF